MNRKSLVLVLAGLADLQLLGHAGGMPQPCIGELGGSVQDLLDDHRYHKIPLPGRFEGDHPFQTNPAHGSQNRLHVAVWSGVEDLKQVIDRDQLFAAQHPPQSEGLLDAQAGEVGLGTLADPLAVPIRLTQKDRWR